MDDRVVVTYYDITERKRAEKALQDSERRYRRLFEAMAEGVALHEMVYDETGTPVDYVIVDANPAYQDQSGIALETALGQRASELYGTGLPPYLDEYAHVAMTGEPTTFEVYFSPLHKHFRISVFSPAAGQFATVFEDITARKRTEQEIKHYTKALERSNADLQQFAYVVSHDLKAPLRMVKSFVGLLQKALQDQLNAKTEEYIHYVVDGVEQMEALIAALLDYARVDTRGQDPVPTDAEDVLAQVLRTLVFDIEMCNAEVTHDPLPTVLADPTQLAQLFQNLIDNALKFSGDDPPRVHITATPLSKPAQGQGEGNAVSDVWRFAVCDHGIGIALQDHARIFGVFQRLHTRGEYEGTGIGLAICKKIVERHGGRIWVESEVGEGTTFYFTLSGTDVG
jgi:signal transduction histidine kinase